MSSLRDNWTRDAAGEFVNWLEPPYSTPGSGIICLLLEGEEAWRLSHEERMKRIVEYYALIRRQWQKRAGA